MEVIALFIIMLFIGIFLFSFGYRLGKWAGIDFYSRISCNAPDPMDIVKINEQIRHCAKKQDSP